MKLREEAGKGGGAKLRVGSFDGPLVGAVAVAIDIDIVIAAAIAVAVAIAVHLSVTNTYCADRRFFYNWFAAGAETLCRLYPTPAFSSLKRGREIQHNSENDNHKQQQKLVAI